MKSCPFVALFDPNVVLPFVTFLIIFRLTLGHFTLCRLTLWHLTLWHLTLWHLTLGHLTLSRRIRASSTVQIQSIWEKTGLHARLRTVHSTAYLVTGLYARLRTLHSTAYLVIFVWNLYELKRFNPDRY